VTMQPSPFRRSDASIFDRPTGSLRPMVAAVDGPMDAPPSVSLAAGTTIGPYHVLRSLGRGGMGEVVEAIDVRSGTHVAIKASTRRLEDAAERARCLDEGRIAATISHPNVVYVLAVDDIDGVPLVVTELVNGGTLRELVQERGQLSVPEAVDLMRQVSDGLDAVHRSGVLHRDVKPSNCFIDETGRVKVGDFGLALSTRHVVGPGDSHQAVAGTLAFASPEQLRGEPLDVRSDVYSAGATLYFLLTGKPPFACVEASRTSAEGPGRPPPSLRADRPDVPRGLDRVMRQCLAARPDDRPRSCRALARLIEPYAAASAAPARLGVRTLAAVVDMIILRAATGAVVLFAMQWYQSAPPFLPFVVAPHLVVMGLYFGLSEALWTASPGKRLLGLRVVRTGMRPVGASRAFARVGLWLTATAPGVVAMALGPANAVAIAAEGGVSGLAVSYATTLAGFALLFVTARRRNGFAGLHDLLTDTRVVSRVTVTSLGAGHVHVPAPPDRSDDAARLGNYRLVDVCAPAGVLVGHDDLLSRPVWIRRGPVDATDVGPARRQVSRPTRLRWLASGRDDRLAWDVYEAAEGDALVNVCREPRPWSAVRGWLLDLADEIAASGQDGTDALLSLDRVWIANDRAILLDWSTMTAEGPADARPAEQPLTATRFLHQVATFALGHRRGSAPLVVAPPLPLHVQAFLDELSADRDATAGDVADRLHLLTHTRVIVTRSRRLVHLLTCAAIPLISVLVVMPLLVVVLPLLARSPDAFLLDACLRRLEQLEPAATPAAIQERTAIDRFLVGRFRPILADDAGSKPWFWPLIEARRPIVQAALVREPDPSPAEVDRAARALVGLRLGAERTRERAAARTLGWRLLLAVILAAVTVTAVAGLLSALVVPGGAFFAQLDLAVVGPDGRPVTRRRGFARAVIAWSPGLAASGALWLATRGVPLDDLGGLHLAPSLVLFALFATGGLLALHDPGRGPQDRMAGTAIVPL
jgi:eukaryotic-like serine/threonine-protein kinase